MDKELLYNQSGIKDETAYKAMSNFTSGGDSAFMNTQGINKGEIWEITAPNGLDTRYVVVLNCFENYAATIMLQEREPGSNAVPVRAREIMYAEAGRLGYTYYDKMVDFVRALSTEEDQELRQAIGNALELPFDEQPYESMAADANREIEGLQLEISELRKELAKAQEETENQAEELEAAANRVAELEAERKTAAAAVQGNVELIEERGLREELAAARREAEIYKGLYENMLARALG